MVVTDEVLLFRYLDEDDRGSFEELVLRYRPPLLNYLRRYYRNHADREDVVQTTFVRVLQKGRTFKRHLRLRPWLYAIAFHEATDRLRRRRRVVLEADYGSGCFEECVDDNAGGPGFEIELAERRQQLQRVVDALPAIYRLAVTAVYFDELPRREAAKLLGVCEPTLRTRLRTALKQLRRQLLPADVA